MKSKKLKLLSIVLSACLCIGLAACGNTTKEEETAKASGETEVEDTETGNAEIYWFSDVSGWGPSGWESGVESSPVLDAVKEKTGLSFQIEQPPTDADTKLGLMIASGELPDLMSVSDSDIINQLIRSGKVWDMQSFLEEYAPDSHLLSDFPEDIKQALTEKFGNWYSYPSHMNSADCRKTLPTSDPIYEATATKGSNSAIMFNGTIMKELGISQDDVMTEKGFYAACQKILDEGYQVDGKPVIPVILQGDGWISSSLDSILANNFGAVPVDNEGKYRHLELSPGYKNALKFVNNCITKGYLDVNSLTIDETALNSYLEAGQVFCWIGNSAQFQKKHLIPFASYGPILADNGSSPVMGVSQQAGTGWIQTLISKDCKYPEKIAEMLSFISSKEGMLLNEYGVEGQDYTIDESGIVNRTEEGKKRYEEQYKMNMWLWPFNNTAFAWNTTLPEGEETDSGTWNYVSTAMGRYEGTYIYDSSLLSFLDGTVIEPSSDLGINLSQIDKYIEAQKAKIVTAKDEGNFETEYQSMIDTLNKYKITEIDEEYNTIYQNNCNKFGVSIEDVNASLYK